MELLLIRHALPIRREVEVGPADPDLDERGRAQALLLADYLASEKIDAIYASPLKRAMQTAAPTAASQGLEVVIEDDVAEYDRNSNEYVPVEELKAAGDPRWKQIISGEMQASLESPEEFHTRVVNAVERLIDAHSGGRIAVVCHGGVIGRYTGHILGQPKDSPGFFYPNYTSIHRVAAARSGERTIITLNETAHLRGAGLPIGVFQK
jgi:2,3-bisphosphoglycerate-dependent phosphoglycerate mutase